MATLVNWSNEHISEDEHQYPHRPDLMTLDDVTEINRLTGLIHDIHSGNPPSYYIALREAEVHNIRRVIMRNPSNTPEQEVFYSRESTGNELGGIFDTNQIKLIQAKINSIRKAALAGEGNNNNTNDGPGGHEVLHISTTQRTSHLSLPLLRASNLHSFTASRRFTQNTLL
jgi:hypothetical protein